MQNISIKYYEEHAEEFIKATEHADMDEIRTEFLNYIPAGGYILDWGCGSGRDALFFMEKGYRVDATDASENLCRLVREYTGIPVRNEEFSALEAEEMYDGIWACASLLHLKITDLPGIIRKGMDALKPEGIFYLSFKHGDFEGMRGGRYFTDMTARKFEEMMTGAEGIKIEKQWITSDVRKGRGDEQWINFLLKKVRIH